MSGRQREIRGRDGKGERDQRIERERERATKRERRGEIKRRREKEVGGDILLCTFRRLRYCTRNRKYCNLIFISTGLMACFLHTKWLIAIQKIE